MTAVLNRGAAAAQTKAAEIAELADAYLTARPGDLFAFGEPLCAQADPEAWFPDGPNTRVKRICRRCPVQPECLYGAVHNDHPDDGVRGGASYRDRCALRRHPQIRRAL